MGEGMKTYQGLLTLHSWGESDDVLFLSSLREPLAEELSWMHGKKVCIRYWITNKECSKNEAAEAAMLIMIGAANVILEAAYSDITGYLWTDEELNIGGHNLMTELKSNVGKWLILEVTEA
jgi:hypothetical protein